MDSDQINWQHIRLDSRLLVSWAHSMEALTLHDGDSWQLAGLLAFVVAAGIDLISQLTSFTSVSNATHIKSKTHAPRIYSVHFCKATLQALFSCLLFTARIIFCCSTLICCLSSVPHE